jgi:hypothetical protein
MEPDYDLWLQGRYLGIGPFQKEENDDEKEEQDEDDPDDPYTLYPA